MKKVRKIGKILMAIIVIAICILVHELGHYAVFQLWGIPTKLAITPILMGVKPPVPIENLPPLQLASVALAGPLANLLFAILWGFFFFRKNRKMIFTEILDLTKEFVRILVHPLGWFQVAGETIEGLETLGKLNFSLGMLALSILIGISQLIPFPPFDGWLVLRSITRLVFPYHLALQIEIRIVQAVIVAITAAFIRDIIEAYELLPGLFPKKENK